MPKVPYGNTVIHYSIHEAPRLKTHYISVDNKTGVVLKGERLPEHKAHQLILNKAGWITRKLLLVSKQQDEAIVTGSRMPYLGKTYYVDVVYNTTYVKAEVGFTYSKFIVKISPDCNVQESIKEAFNSFYKTKAIEKLTPRLEALSKKTKLHFKAVSFRAMKKRWGSCTRANQIIINIEAVKLPFSLIDYLLIHELCHTKIKDHSKAFWSEVSKHVSKWKLLDEKMTSLKF
jgi:predicted metal-dependent hydrolase